MAEEASLIKELDPRIIDDELLTASIEELENFEVGSHDSTKCLQVGKNLLQVLKEKLKDFLRNNLDVFAWKYKDMVGKDSKTSCHHLKIDPQANLH